MNSQKNATNTPARESRESTDAALTLELATYLVLDGRRDLVGRVKMSQEARRRLDLTLTRLGDEEQCWRQTVSLAVDSDNSVYSFTIPVGDLPGGMYRLTAQSEGGRQASAMIAVLGLVPPVAQPSPGYLEFVIETVEKLFGNQVKRLGGNADGTPFIIVSRRSSLGYRSLGHKEDGEYQTYWFPETPFEYDAFRADHEVWSVLDRLSELSGDPRYRNMATGMLDAVAEHAFDPRSGLIYLSEESDLHVPENRVCACKSGTSEPAFKPRNTGHNPGMHLERMWERMPTQLHRSFRAMYYGLITDPDNFDYNRFCMFGFSDADRKPSMGKNSGHCAFDTAGGRMIHWWCSCWAHTGDTDCLHWARRMTDRWHAVMHPDSGLIPNFFGCADWQPGADQAPGIWAEARGAALTAASWMDAAQALSFRSGAAELRTLLTSMALRLARGLARHAYDVDQRLFREHLHLDGRPYEGTARYCFHTQSEKDAAVAQNPRMAQVAVYRGSGFYRNPPYYEHCAGSNVPVDLARVMARARDAELTARVAAFAADALDEAHKLTGPLTAEGRWTFRATGWYIRVCVLLYRTTGESRYLDWARELADREIASLRQVACPDWWRMRERSTFLDALLDLYSVTARVEP